MLLNTRGRRFFTACAEECLRIHPVHNVVVITPFETCGYCGTGMCYGGGFCAQCLTDLVIGEVRKRVSKKDRENVIDWWNMLIMCCQAYAASPGSLTKKVRLEAKLNFVALANSCVYERFEKL